MLARLRQLNWQTSGNKNGPIWEVGFAFRILGKWCKIINAIASIKAPKHCSQAPKGKTESNAEMREKLLIIKFKRIAAPSSSNAPQKFLIQK